MTCPKCGGDGLLVWGETCDCCLGWGRIPRPEHRTDGQASFTAAVKEVETAKVTEEEQAK